MSKSKLINTLGNITDEQEKRNEILKSYFYGYYQQEIKDAKEQPFSEVSLDDMIDVAMGFVSNNIDNVKYSAENCCNRIAIFGFTHLDKFSQSNDGVRIVKKENMPRNFNQNEMDFFTLSYDVILEFYQQSNGISALTKEEDNNWDLDAINFSKKVFSVEFLRFDDNLNNNQTHNILYDY